MNKTYSFQESKDFSNAKFALKYIANEIKAMKDKYENMSVDEMYKQVLQNRPVSSGIG